MSELPMADVPSLVQPKTQPCSSVPQNKLPGRWVNKLLKGKA